MAKITYIEANGVAHVADIEVGLSVMQGAVSIGVAGVVAECGGNCACGTCRIYVDEAWWGKTGEASEIEAATMDITKDPLRGKRLSCQITVTDELNGLVVRIPNSQF